MVSLSRRFQAVTNFLTSPLFVGILIGASIHYIQRLNNGSVGYTIKDDLAALEDKLEFDESLPVVIENKDEAQDDHKKEAEEKKEKTFVRPRFVKEELNITKKLLVVIVPDVDWMEDEVMKKFYNDTLHPHITEVTWLKRDGGGSPDVVDAVKTIGGDMSLSGYQFYLILPSSALVVSRNLRSLVDPLLLTEETFMAMEGEEEGVCLVKSGVLLSSHIIKGMNENMDWCHRNKVSYDQSLNLQNCIFHSTKVKCNSNLYTASKYSSQLSSLGNSVVVYDVSSESQMKMLMQNVKLTEIRLYKDEQSKLEEQLSSLINTSKYDLSSSWPLGSVKSFKSWDRFDMGIFHHFNQTHHFFADDYDSADKMPDRDSEDIGSLLNLCNLQPEDFSAGWSRVDATRGKDIVLEVSHRANDRKVSSRRCQIVKELANPEIVAMPFVTESFKISLIVPVQEKDSQKTMTLLRSFAKNCIEKNDRIFLMLVFLYTPERPDKNNNNDFFKEVKQLALQISKKYKKDGSKSSSHLLWYSMQTKGVVPSNMELMDLVTQKLDNKTIILLGSPDMEMKGDYFNRVRMNTIQSKQVFCAIPFTEYHPSIVYGDKRPPVTMTFNTTAGHFDPHNFGHVSFYKSDYLLARQDLGGKVISHESELRDVEDARYDLCALFRHKRAVHALRAPDPSLMLRYEEINCDTVLEEEKSDCLVRYQRSFAKRKTLATQVLDREEKLANNLPVIGPNSQQNS